MIFVTTGHSLRVTTSTTAATDFYVSYADKDTTNVTPGSARAAVTTATTTSLITGPATGQRLVKVLTGRNKSNSASQTVTVIAHDGTTAFDMFQCTLQPGESFQYDESGQFRTFDNAGRQKVTAPAYTPITARTVPFIKVGTAKEAAGVWYSFGKDAGVPGAWSPGTPGLNGRATDGLSAADAGGVKFHFTKAAF